MSADNTEGNTPPISLEMAGIQSQRPGLADASYTVTSPRDPVYNCVAYAAGVTDDWWSHSGIYTWPDAPRSPNIGSLITVFRRQGYELCEDANAEAEAGYEKVALYAADGRWTHASRQLPGGQWSSKRGVLEDISHQSPQSLAGGDYGEVHCIMRRKRADG